MQKQMTRFIDECTTKQMSYGENPFRIRVLASDVKKRVFHGKKYLVCRVNNLGPRVIITHAKML